MAKTTTELLVPTLQVASATSLSVLLSGELGASVGDANVQLSCALYDVLTLARGHVVGDLCRVFPAFGSKISHGVAVTKHTCKKKRV